jgi:hypothetical protein
MKPQRPLDLKSTQPANVQQQHTFTHIKNTHRHPHNTKFMHEKLLMFFFFKWKMPVFYKGVSELSLALLRLLPTPLQNEILKSLLPEGALRALPSKLTYPIQLPSIVV